MATKKEVDELSNEIARLKELVWAHETEIAKLKSTENELRSRLFIANQTNEYLSSERERLSRSDNIHSQTNVHLMRAIAILGEKQMKEDSDEIWHSCRPNVSQAMSSENNQKEL